MGWVGGLGIPTLSCLIKGRHGSRRLNSWLDSRYLAIPGAVRVVCLERSQGRRPLKTVLVYSQLDVKHIYHIIIIIIISNKGHSRSAVERPSHLVNEIETSFSRAEVIRPSKIEKSDFVRIFGIFDRTPPSHL